MEGQYKFFLHRGHGEICKIIGRAGSGAILKLLNNVGGSHIVKFGLIAIIK